MSWGEAEVQGANVCTELIHVFAALLRSSDLVEQRSENLWFEFVSNRQDQINELSDFCWSPCLKWKAFFFSDLFYQMKLKVSFQEETYELLAVYFLDVLQDGFFLLFLGGKFRC